MRIVIDSLFKLLWGMLFAPLLIALSYPIFWVLGETTSLSDAEVTLGLLWLFAAIVIALLQVLEDANNARRTLESHIHHVEASRDEYIQRFLDSKSSVNRSSGTK
jgi:hypothetical protein